MDARLGEIKVRSAWLQVTFSLTFASSQVLAARFEDL